MTKFPAKNSGINELIWTNLTAISVYLATLFVNPASTLESYQLMPFLKITLVTTNTAKYSYNIYYNISPIYRKLKDGVFHQILTVQFQEESVKIYGTPRIR